MRPLDLLSTAEDLVNYTRGKPRQANLLRATSTIYYALFHTLARSCANCIIGGSGSDRSKAAWKQTYRALEHGSVRNSLKQKQTIELFPQGIQDFANSFVTFQEKRHRADYDPDEKVYKSSVLVDLGSARKVITDFEKTKLKDRRAFAALVLLKKR